MNPLRHPAYLRCLVFALIVTCTSLDAAEKETWTVAGKTYANVRVLEVTPATVTIAHSGGMVQLDLGSLPTELQERFDYHPEAAQAWSAEARTQLAESTEQVERVTRDRIRRAELVEIQQANAERATAFDDPSVVRLKPEVDLRSVFVAQNLYLKDQGRRPSCSVFAVVGALEYEYARQYGSSVPLSEEFLIWAVNQVAPATPIDDGIHFQEVLLALQTHGVPMQSLMPNTFGKKIEDIKPSDAAIREAASRRNAGPLWLRRNDPSLIAQIIRSLNEGTPVVVGARWPHSRTLEHSNLVSEQTPLKGPGHAVTLVGYRNVDNNPDNIVFIFRNSWGVSWGMGGCGHITAAYLKENLLTGFTLHLISEAPAG